MITEAQRCYKMYYLYFSIVGKLDFIADIILKRIGLWTPGVTNGRNLIKIPLDIVQMDARQTYQVHEPSHARVLGQNLVSQELP